MTIKEILAMNNKTFSNEDLYDIFTDPEFLEDCRNDQYLYENFICSKCGAKYTAEKELICCPCWEYE